VNGQPTPEVGMGATLLCWTDRHAATITKVETIGGRTMLTVQEDTSTRVSGSTQDGSASYAYAANPNGCEHHYRQLPSGQWQKVWLNLKTKRWNACEGEGLRIGSRE